MPNRKDKNGIMTEAYVRRGVVLINLVFKPQSAEYTFKYTKYYT